MCIPRTLVRLSTTSIDLFFVVSRFAEDALNTAFTVLFSDAFRCSISPTAAMPNCVAGVDTPVTAAQSGPGVVGPDGSYGCNLV